jgi:signal transduction histidine kinase
LNTSQTQPSAHKKPHTFLKKWVEGYIPSLWTQNKDTYLRARLLLNAIFLIMGLAGLCGMICLLAGVWIGVWVCLTEISLSVLLVFSLPFLKRLKQANRFFLIKSSLFFWVLIWLTGGIRSPFLVWLLVVPIFAFILFRRKEILNWAWASVVEVLLLFGLDYTHYTFLIPFPDLWLEVVYLLTFLASLGYLLWMILMYEQGRERTIRQMQKTRDDIFFRKHELREQRDTLEQQYHEVQALKHELEKTIAERTEHLQRANEELDLFLYRSSHDLRRPITSLLGLFELTRLEMGKPASYQLLGLMNTTAQNMDRMLKKLIMISELNYEHIVPVKINFKRLLDKSMQPLLPIIRKNQIQWTIEEELPTDFFSNYLLLESIIFNLIENAVTFRNQTFEDKPQIYFLLKIIENNLWIQVKDNGMGIPAESQDKIFKMFYKGTAISQGNGLGLYIVKKSVEKLAGDINIESQENIGTIVNLTIPNQAPTTIIE